MTNYSPQGHSCCCGEFVFSTKININTFIITIINLLYIEMSLSISVLTITIGVLLTIMVL